VSVTERSAVSPAEAAAAVLSPADVATSDAALRQLLHGLPGVDQVGAVQRAAGLGHPVDQEGRQALGAGTPRSAWST